MILNYIKIALRNILRNKLHSTINIIGLSIGLASCMLILLYVFNEINYDRFFENHNRVYRVNTYWKSSEGETTYATSPPPLAEIISQSIPEVEKVTRLYTWSDFTLRPDTDSSNVYRETNVYAAGKSFFEIFDGRLIKGDPAKVLNNPASVVMSKSAAIRYFGAEAYENNDIVDHNLLVGKDGSTHLRVTGIMKDWPEQSHMNFELVISSNTYPDDLHRNEEWTWNIMHTYVLLHEPGVSRSKTVEEKLTGVIKQHAMPHLGYNSYDQYQKEGNSMKYALQSVTDIHLKSNLLREMHPNGNIAYVYIFLLIAFLIISLACINFTNLSTAQASRRAKEVGVRKVLGSQRKLLIKQFLSESLLFSFLAMIMSFGILELFMVFGKELFQLKFVSGIFDEWYFIAGIIVLSIIVGVLAGFYPALYLTHFNPAEVLKGRIYHQSKTGNIRNALVIFQFAISIGMIIVTAVINDQLQFMQSKNLGFEKENILVIQNDREIEERRGEFKNVLKNYPEIINVSFSSGVPANKEFHVRDYTLEGNESGVGFNWYQIDPDYIPALGMEIVEGRNFSQEIASDSSGIILNQKAVETLGLADPVDEFIIISKGNFDERKVRVIGVVKNFNFESFQKEIKPLGMEYLTGYVFKDYISVRIAPGKEREAVSIIKEIWKKFEPEVPLTYSFLDTNFDSLFRSEKRMGKIFNLFTGLAIIIACLGLFGLASYVTEQRRREIGIRKVMGASVNKIVMMFAKSFIGMTLIGFFLAAPVAYFAIERWLQSFAYRTLINNEIFILSGILTIAITLITVGYQSVKTALENPVNSLKEE